MPYTPSASYDPHMTIRETEIAIKAIKDIFERTLAEALNLTRVSAPLFVFPESGLNDNLNGVERPVSFDVKHAEGKHVEIVHSLAKWKRYALKRYGFGVGEGLYTDMNAIRRDEEMDCLHSIYVDQWDWEKVITKDMRNTATLQKTVEQLFGVFKKVEAHVNGLYPFLTQKLPEKIIFMTAQELEDLYPNLTPKERENEACKAHGAIFLSQIGGALASGKPHDGRAPDYDDWQLNGDLLFWHPALNCALELSSMGIRVDEDTLVAQTKTAGCEDRLQFEFHQGILNKTLPYTIGGGLGQSRICMFLLERAHIGEVQSSIWDAATLADCAKQNIQLL